MADTFRALCAELLRGLDENRHPEVRYPGHLRQIMASARAALTDEPAVPEVVGSEWQPCVKLPITVHVREQRPGEQHVSTREGITPVQPDDLIMLGVAGEEYPIGRELFQRTYRMGSADEPAVPEGREPASVASEPSDEEWDALVERAWDKYQTVGYQGERFMYDGDFGSALDLVRKELARWGNLKVSLTSSPPADGEVADRAAELLQRQALVMAWKRLPGPGDCDAEGRCWWFCPPDFIELRSHTSAESAFVAGATHCLPAHALPLPEVNND